jgi:hypothetical protein
MAQIRSHFKHNPYTPPWPSDQDPTARIQFGRRGNLESTRAVHQGINGWSPAFHTECPGRRRPSSTRWSARRWWWSSALGRHPVPQGRNGEPQHKPQEMANAQGVVLPAVVESAGSPTVTSDPRRKDCSGEQIPTPEKVPKSGNQRASSRGSDEVSPARRSQAIAHVEMATGEQARHQVWWQSWPAGDGARQRRAWCLNRGRQRGSRPRRLEIGSQTPMAKPARFPRGPCSRTRSGFATGKTGPMGRVRLAHGARQPVADAPTSQESRGAGISATPIVILLRRRFWRWWPTSQSHRAETRAFGRRLQSRAHGEVPHDPS